MNLKIKELIYYVNMLKIMIFFYFKKLLDFVVKDFIECWKNYKILIYFTAVTILIVCFSQIFALVFL